MAVITFQNKIPTKMMEEWHKDFIKKKNDDNNYYNKYHNENWLRNQPLNENNK